MNENYEPFELVAFISSKVLFALVSAEAYSEPNQTSKMSFM